jgi:Dyp-type peroxidase family
MIETPLRLSDIQGNILAGFKNDHQAFMLLSFGDGADAQINAQSWLGSLAGKIASTRQMRRARPPLRNISLTYSGLIVLDPTVGPTLDGFHAFRRGPTGVRPDAVIASAGPANRAPLTTAELLGDIDENGPRNWVFGASNEGQSRVDALLTVAADDAVTLLAEVGEQQTHAEGRGLHVVYLEAGERLRGPDNHTEEHFGFRDGISQPAVRGFAPASKHYDAAAVKAGEFLLGYEQEPDCMVPGHVGHSLVSHPPRWMHDGSFQVFRRLNQDVREWWEQVEYNSQVLGKANIKVTPEELAAKLVGRWPDGAPVALAGNTEAAAALHPDQYNRFDYSGDLDGELTPRFAHIRKANPRQQGRFCENSHRILRRGIAFGPRFDPEKDEVEGADVERGLLFNAFMANIEKQFEHIQQNWANNPRFPTADFDPASDPHNGDGSDAVIGAVIHGSRCAFRQRGKTNWLNFRRYVRTTGMVYAFAPSISTLISLANSRPLPE